MGKGELEKKNIRIEKDHPQSLHSEHAVTDSELGTQVCSVSSQFTSISEHSCESEVTPR